MRSCCVDAALFTSLAVQRGRCGSTEEFPGLPHPASTSLNTPLPALVKFVCPLACFFLPPTRSSLTPARALLLRRFYAPTNVPVPSTSSHTRTLFEWLVQKQCLQVRFQMLAAPAGACTTASLVPVMPPVALVGQPASGTAVPVLHAAPLVLPR